MHKLRYWWRFWHGRCVDCGRQVRYAPVRRGTKFWDTPYCLLDYQRRHRDYSRENARWHQFYNARYRYHLRKEEPPMSLRATIIGKLRAQGASSAQIASASARLTGR